MSTEKPLERSEPENDASRFALFKIPSASTSRLKNVEEAGVKEGGGEEGLQGPGLADQRAGTRTAGSRANRGKTERAWMMCWTK